MLRLLIFIAAAVILIIAAVLAYAIGIALRLVEIERELGNQPPATHLLRRGPQ